MLDQYGVSATLRNPYRHDLNGQTSALGRRGGTFVRAGSNEIEAEEIEENEALEGEAA